MRAEPGSSQGWPVTGPEASGTKCPKGSFHLNTGELPLRGCPKVAQRGCGVSVSGGV